MRLTEQARASRRRTEQTRDRRARLSPVIEARRRLNALRAAGIKTVDLPGPRDPRYGYPTQSHD
jgi:hypothetical protein